MWGFCQRWIWDVLHSFLVKEGYTMCTESPGEVTKRIQEISHTQVFCTVGTSHARAHNHR